MKRTCTAAKDGTRYGRIFSLSTVLLLAGCASEGPLRPPTLWLPAAVHGLNAQRAGGAVDLVWTNPTRTTDGVSLTGKKHNAGALSAQICRAEIFAPAVPCTPIATIAVSAGAPANFHDSLPSDLQAGPDRALRYRIRVLNGVGRGGGFAEILTVAGDAPAAVRGLTASPVTGGIALRWQPGATPQDRTLLRVTRGDAPPAVAFRNTPDAQTATPVTRAPATTLMAVEAGPRDAGGALDAGGRAGVEQHYTVYRSRSAHVGGADLIVNGEAASVTVVSTALAPPPLPPTGLEAVANTLGAPSIDLVWQASTEPGVAGYVVFRSEGLGVPSRLTPTPVLGFSYTDATAQPGSDYRYSVAAVSTDGRAGERGREIHASIPRP